MGNGYVENRPSKRQHAGLCRHAGGEHDRAIYDPRVIGGQHSLLFGPYAGFSGKFLKHGSLLDLFESVRPANIKPLLSVARDNFDLTEYLIGQVLQSESHRLAALDEYFPNAKLKTGGLWSSANRGRHDAILDDTRCDDLAR